LAVSPCKHVPIVAKFQGVCPAAPVDVSIEGRVRNDNERRVAVAKKNVADERAVITQDSAVFEVNRETSLGGNRSAVGDISVTVRDSDANGFRELRAFGDFAFLVFGNRN